MNAKKATQARKPKFIDRFKPQLSIVPDSKESHTEASSKTCGATRNIAGEIVTCTLPKLHGGRHTDGARTFRPSSGDSE